MSRSKNSKQSDDRAITKAKEHMEAARRSERKALERVRQTGNPDHRREFIRLAGAAQKAEDAYLATTRMRDTGWKALQTSHGTRYHRERGRHLQFDIELQITTWICSAVERNVLRRTIRGHVDAATAAAAIEREFAIPTMPLPEETETK